MSSYMHYGMERFVERAWNGIFTSLLKPETQKRWSFVGTVGHTTIRIYEMAGRLMVQFEDASNADNYVCYITDDRDEKGEHFGLQSYNGSYREHDEMFREAMTGWELHGAGLWKHSKKQSIG